MLRGVLISILVFLALSIMAQEVSEVMVSDLPELDETLFRANDFTEHEDLYNEATKYYRTPVSQRRRGVDWWIGNRILEDHNCVVEDFEGAINIQKMRLFGSTREYTAGGELELSRVTKRDWNLSADLNARMGRDANIAGVFNQDFRGEFSVGKLFGERHYMRINLITPIMMEGLQGGASAEAITLTGDNLYNPAWGYYDGEVRNSRVRRYRVPKLNIRYQLPIAESTMAAFTLNTQMGRSSLSRLGWYDSYNPTPDYYRKLPSYISDSELRADVEQLWHDQDSDYTQIAWDDLVVANKRSDDGEAHYIIEDQVQKITRADVALLFQSRLGALNLRYGVRYEMDHGRYFKEMNDLLGADYLIDLDQYIGDYSHTNNDLQNDLRNPNRNVTKGDRFGYDYTLATQSAHGVLGLEYHSNSLSVNLSGEFGEEQIKRIGHYEKERFAGALSYGESNTVSLPSSSARMDVSFSPTGRHSILFSAATNLIAADARDLFIQAQNANRIVDDAKSQSINFVNLGYKYKSPDFMVDFVGYFIRSRGEIQTWQGYDDLTYNYSDVVVSDLGFSSYGVEIVSNYEVGRRLRLEATIAAGDYTYDTAPTVTLYDDTDMTLSSTSVAEAVVGCKVGNAPQLVTTLGATYFAENSFILSVDCSYAAGRYIAPSFMRRTDRVIRGTGSPELEEEIVAQSNLGAVFDITLGVTKTFWLANEDRVSLSVRVNNLMGDRDRVDYARESNRILRTASSSSTGGYYLQPHIYYYERPRTYYISCNYLF